MGWRDLLSERWDAAKNTVANEVVYAGKVIDDKIETGKEIVGEVKSVVSNEVAYAGKVIDNKIETGKEIVGEVKSVVTNEAAYVGKAIGNKIETGKEYIKEAPVVINDKATSLGNRVGDTMEKGRVYVNNTILNNPTVQNWAENLRNASLPGDGLKDLDNVFTSGFGFSKPSVELYVGGEKKDWKIDVSVDNDLDIGVNSTAVSVIRDSGYSEAAWHDIKKFSSGFSRSLDQNFTGGFIDNKLNLPQDNSLAFHAGKVTGDISKGAGSSEPGENTFSRQGLELLADLELPDEEYYKNYFFRDKDGKIIGIKPYLVGDDGITIGYGHYTGFNDAAGLKWLKDKYSIDENMTQAQLDKIMIPIEDCLNILNNDVSRNVTAINSFLKDYKIGLKQNEFDALVINRYNKGSLYRPIRDALKSGSRDREVWEDALFDGLDPESKFYNGWKMRRQDELEVFLDNDYTRIK